MRSPSAFLAHILLGCLTLLSAGAIVLSILTAPPVAREQLRVAAKNTAAASSFVLVYRVSQHEPRPSADLNGKSSVTMTERVEYQSPDRLEVTSTTAPGRKLIVIGGNRYDLARGGRWTALPPIPSAGTSIGAQEAQQLLFPLASLGDATSVVRKGSTYRFDPGQRSVLLSDFFGSLAPILSSVGFTAALNGEFVSFERIVASRGSAHFGLDIRFQSVEAVPPIVAPRVG